MDSRQLDIPEKLNRALAMVRQHTIVLWWLVFVGLLKAATTLLGDTTFSRILSTSSFVLSIFSTPVIYGIYYELIEDIYSSITNLIRTYTLPYLWLLVRMYLPVVLIAWLPILLNPNVSTGGHFHVILVSFSLIYLYVLPFFYFAGKQRGSIYLGITFLLRNISASTPLILVVLFLETVLLLVQYSKTALLARSIFLFTIIDFSSYLVASIIDFVLFIILILILKNEYGKSGSVDNHQHS